MDEVKTAKPIIPPVSQSALGEQAFFNILEDLRSERENLAQQRIAILNILEDVNGAQAKLNRKYQEVDVSRDLTQRLSNTLEYHTIMNEVAKALRQILPDRDVAYIAAPQGGNIVAEEKLRIYLGHNLAGPSYCDALAKATAAYLAASPDFAGSLPADKPEVLKLTWELAEGELDPASTLQMLSVEFFILKITGSFVGLFASAAGQDIDLSEEDWVTTQSLIDNAVLTVARLRTLVASEQSRIGDLVETMTSGILMYDANRMPVIVNRFMRQLVQEQKLSLPEFIALFTVTDKAGGTMKQAIEGAFTGKTSYFNEVTLGKRYFEAQIAPVKDYLGQISGGVVMLHDITRLKEVDKMKTEFVSLASHQLRTPLTAIKLFVEMLFDEEGVGPLNQLQHSYLQDLSDSTVRMIKLVNDLLNVSRLESGRLRIIPEPTDLVALLEDVIKEARVIAGPNYTIKLKTPKKKWPNIMLDQALVRQVAHNLIMNAVRYSATADKPLIEIILAEDQDFYQLAVNDNGIGISADNKPRIFEKFFRAPNALQSQAEGSGLGLYVAKMVVEATGGHIWFDSAGVGKGTIFYVEMPKTGMVRREGEVGLSPA